MSKRHKNESKDIWGEYHKWEDEKEKKIERCGWCGALLNISIEEFEALPEGERNRRTELSDCGCNQQEEHDRYVTRDMAIDAGDINLEGLRY